MNIKNILNLKKYLIILYCFSLAFNFPLLNSINNKSFFGFNLYQVINHFISSEIFFKLTLSTILLCLILVFKFISLIYERVSFRLRIYDFIPFILFIYAALVNKLIHNYSFQDNYFTSFGLNSFFILILINEFRLSQSLRNLSIFAFLSSCLACVFLSIGSLFTDSFLIDYGLSRASLLSWNAGEYAFLLAFAYTFLVIILTNLKLKDKYFYLIGIVSFTCITKVIYDTGSRSAFYFLVFINIIILYSILIKRYGIDLRLKRLKLLLITTLAFIIPAINNKILVYRNPFLLRISQAFVEKAPELKTKKLEFSEENFLELGGRLERWKNTVELIKENLLWGNGFERISQPHNFFLEVFIVGGIIAFMILMIYVIYLFYFQLNYYLISGRDNLLMYGFFLLVCFNTTNIIHIKFVWFALAIFLSTPFNYKMATPKIKNSQTTLGL